MLVRSVIDYQVQYDLEAKRVSPVQDLLKLLQGAIIRMDVPVV